MNSIKKTFGTFKKGLSELDYWVNQGVVFSKDEIEELTRISNDLEKQIDTIVTFQDSLEKLKKRD
jgi:hypothetical protein